MKQDATDSDSDPGEKDVSREAPDEDREGQNAAGEGRNAAGEIPDAASESPDAASQSPDAAGESPDQRDLHEEEEGATGDDEAEFEEYSEDWDLPPHHHRGTSHRIPRRWDREEE